MKLAPFSGDEIETAGGVFATVTVTWVDRVAPSASVTVAVMTCVPFESRLVKLAPAPMAPSLLDVHERDPLRVP